MSVAAIWFYYINIHVVYIYWKRNAFMFILHNSYSICLQVLRLRQHFLYRIRTFLFEANFLSLIFPPFFLLFFFDCTDPWNYWDHQPAEDPERVHVEFCQRSSGLYQRLAAVPVQRPQGSSICLATRSSGNRGTLSWQISCCSHCRHSGPICNVARETVSAVDNFKAVV